MKHIRQSTSQDLEALLSLFGEARKTIAALGIDQWQNGYPNREVIEADIARGESFVVEEDGELVATFVIMKGEEPTYKKIYDGEWLTGGDGAYTAVHRFTIAPKMRGRGIASDMINYAACQAFAQGKCSLRIDTHEGNIVMRRMLEKNGFSYTGVIYLASGDARVAYEKILSQTITHLQNQSCEALRSFVEGNIGYSVLYRILGTKCKHIFTNFRDIIVCHSENPYPVWVYCPKINEQTTPALAALIKEHFPVDTHNLILPVPLLSSLAEHDPYFRQAPVKMQMLAYRLDTLLPLDRQATGEADLATEDDLETLARYRQAVCLELDGVSFSLDECREKMRGELLRGNFYVWRDGGEIVSTASFVIEGTHARVGAVYTPPSMRRRGYAISLVHAVCEIALRDGLTPILYTNGAYEPSNACYVRIGFRKVCDLFNIGKS